MRKRRFKRIARYYLSWAALYGCMFLAAAAPTAVVAAYLIPEVERRRGDIAMGGEWILLGFIFVFLFNIIDRIVMYKIFGEED
jgi:hypothetical protein